MKVGIMSSSLVPGDAMSNDTVAMYRILKTQGIETYVFSTYSIIPNLPVHHPFEAVDLLKTPQDVMIYQHGCGYYNALLVLNELSCRKIVKYHNVTPPQFFKQDPMAVTYCEEGIKQTYMLAKTVPEFWVASEFSAQEIRGMGHINVSVIPPFHHIQDLVDSPEDKPLFDKTKFNVVMVGRVVPHKNIEAALEIIARYKKTYNKNIRLIVVGSLDQASHISSLKNQIQRLDIEDEVHLVGKVSTSQLKAIYKHADVMLITSHHEGFCVPLIEAMALGLPVISNTETALPYTGGDAVIYVNEHEHQKAADELYRLHSDHDYAAEYRKKALLRYQGHFTTAIIEKQFLELMFFPSIKQPVSLKSFQYIEPHVKLVQLIHQLETEIDKKQFDKTAFKLSFVGSFLNIKKIYRRLRFGDEVSQETVKMIKRLLITQVNDHCEVLSELQQLKNEIRELREKIKN